MKRALLFCCLLLSLACEKEKDSTAVLVGDCTGFYIRVDNLEYKVCNEEIIDPGRIGEHVYVRYTPLDDCSSDGSSACMLYHPYEGYAQVDTIY